MMVIFGSLSGVYIIPTIYEDYSRLQNVAGSKDGMKASLGDGEAQEQMDNVDEFARSAVSAVHQKAQDLRSNSSVVRFCIFGLFLPNWSFYRM